MQKAFNQVTTPPSEAEAALIEWGVEYKKQPDGSIHVPGDLDISGKGLTKLPDLSQVIVGGNFCCHNISRREGHFRHILNYIPLPSYLYSVYIAHYGKLNVGNH